jgi:23S rRNA pseudouridine2457 synthase
MNHSQRPREFRYAIANKPNGVVCAARDHLDRPSLTTLRIPASLHPAGRLDRDSEGLLLLTDDGQTLHRLTHPGFQHAKTYLVLVLGKPDAEALRNLREGVDIKLGHTRPADVEVVDQPPQFDDGLSPVRWREYTSLRMVLREGMNHQIKRMTAAVGHPTLRLMRIAIGPLSLPFDLATGQWRHLTAAECKVLLDWVWPHGRPEAEHVKPVMSGYHRRKVG